MLAQMISLGVLSLPSAIATLGLIPYAANLPEKPANQTNRAEE